MEITIFKKLGAYLKTHLVPTKSASTSDAKTVASLRFMAITLLIIGLCTSWLGIAPFAYTMLVKFMPPALAYFFCVVICGLISALVDFPLGVFIPSIFDKLFAEKNSKLIWYKMTALIIISGCLSSITMSLSSSGGEMTTKQLFEADRPNSHAIGTIALDSTLQARGAEIKKAAAAEIATATAKDKAIKSEAVKLMQTAQFLAAKKFPEYKTSPYHRNQYNKVVDKARIDSTNTAATARNLETEQQHLNMKLASTNTAFQEETEGKKKALDAEWKEYEHKMTVANLFLSDLGYYTTPLFWLICLLTVLMGLSEKGGVAPSGSGRSFQDITKHITQQLARLQQAIDNASATSSYAANILAIYDEVEIAYPAEFAAMQIRHSNVYSIFKRKDVEMYM